LADQADGVCVLLILIIAVILGIFIYNMGRNSGYMDGQIDALNGKFKYAPTTQPQYHSGNVKEVTPSR
jgi:hypothetical protein